MLNLGNLISIQIITKSSSVLRSSLNLSSLNLPQIITKSYLSFRKQRTKVGSAYSKWSKIRRGIPEGSILGPLLFNIFINDIFMIIEQSDICNFADDNTLYSCGERLTEITENLVSDTKRILNLNFKFHESQPWKISVHDSWG